MTNTPKSRLRDRLKRYVGVFTPIEKKIIVGAVLGLAVGATGLFIQYRQPHGNTPDYGGELIEGIVASNETEVDTHLSSLLGVGLLKFDENGGITGALAESYTIDNGGKTYNFKLRPNLDGDDVLRQLKVTDAIISSAQTEVKDNTLIIKLNVPFSPLLTNLTSPFYSPGPYFLSKRDSREVVLKSNQEFALGKPYIPSLRFKIFPTQSALDKAVERGQVLSVYDPQVQGKGFNRHTLKLPLYPILFFNLDRDPWKDQGLRQKIVKGEKLDKPISINVTTTSSQRERLSQLEEKLKTQDISIAPQIVSESDLNNRVLANRDFDALLYGIDLSRDPDPYPFWHSSQIGGSGKNLSGYKSKKADKLLEEAREISDYNERLKKYTEFQQLLVNDAPALMLGQKTVDYLVSTKVGGVKVGYGVTQSDRFGNIWEWYIRTKKTPKSD